GAAGGTVEAAQDVEQRALAGTAGAHDGHEGAGPHAEGDARQGIDEIVTDAVAFDDLPQPDHGSVRLALHLPLGSLPHGRCSPPAARWRPSPVPPAGRLRGAERAAGCPRAASGGSSPSPLARASAAGRDGASASAMTSASAISLSCSASS